MKRLIRVLFAEDFAPFRNFLRTALPQNRELEIVGEASNGREAVEKFRDLDPDLIILDIGLPDLNGIEVTRRIRSLSRRPKILIVSQNRSWDIAEEALRSGANGYVVKSAADSELLPAVESVLRGERFISTILAGHDLGESSNARSGRQRQSKDDDASPGQKKRAKILRRHDAGFFSDDRGLVEDTALFVANALKAGNAAIVIATEPHRRQLLARLSEFALDMVAVTEEGRYIALDAADTLTHCMANGMIDPDRWTNSFRALILQASKCANKGTRRVAIFGECVQLLLERGDTESALQMERLGNELFHRYDIDILCGYSPNGLQNEMNGLIYHEICAEHSIVYSR
jgi:DNA-binding NarL/FixJ family response regulator